MKPTNKTFLNFFNFLKDKENEKVPYYIITSLADRPHTPDELVYDGNLDIRHTSKDVIRDIPEGLTVNGNFEYLRPNSQESISNNLTVKGKFFVSDPLKVIKRLPENLTVHGDFFMPQSVVEVPDNLTLHGSFIAHLAKNLEKLPDNFHIKGILYIKEANKLRYLPSNLRVDDYCRIEDSLIEEIPKNTKIGTNLILSNNSNLKVINSGLKVGGSVWLEGTSLEYIGPNVEVEKYIFVENSNIDETNFRERVSRDIKAQVIQISVKDGDRYFQPSPNKGKRYLLTSEGRKLAKKLSLGYKYLDEKSIHLVHVYNNDNN